MSAHDDRHHRQLVHDNTAMGGGSTHGWRRHRRRARTCHLSPAVRSTITEYDLSRAIRPWGSPTFGLPPSCWAAPSTARRGRSRSRRARSSTIKRSAQACRPERTTGRRGLRWGDRVIGTVRDHRSLELPRQRRPGRGQRLRGRQRRGRRPRTRRPYGIAAADVSNSTFVGNLAENGFGGVGYYPLAAAGGAIAELLRLPQPCRMSMSWTMRHSAATVPPARSRTRPPAEGSLTCTVRHMTLTNCSISGNLALGGSGGDAPQGGGPAGNGGDGRGRRHFQLRDFVHERLEGLRQSRHRRSRGSKPRRPGRQRRERVRRRNRGR